MELKKNLLKKIYFKLLIKIWALIKDIIKNSSDFLTEKIIEISKKGNLDNQIKIDKIIDKIIDEDPIKAKEIIDDNKDKEVIKKMIKPKKIKDIKDVIDRNISPNWLCIFQKIKNINIHFLY